MKKTIISQNVEVKKEKTYLYHMVPSDMIGNSLHPLNAMRETHPDLFVSKASKYAGRERVMEQFIPTLKCKWNDVIHFSPINPSAMKQALVDAGMEPYEMRFYQIDPGLLDPNKTTVYLFNHENPDDKMLETNFANYKPDEIETYSKLPEATKTYYREMFQKGERPLLFIGVPHILHKGSVDISDFPIITV
jgi:hypothetical protein